MSETAAPVLTSPLHDRHVAAGARFAEFSGWTMPLEYTGVLAEHTAVRTAAGLFDVSHLGKISVTGAGAADFVNRCLTNDLGRIGAGQAQYTLICSADGGIVDDIIAYRYDDDRVFLIPNAGNCATVAAQLAAAAPESVQVVDQHREFAILAVQGPASDAVLTAAGLPVGHPYLSFRSGAVDDVAVTVCRTGYTGERGYELVVAADQAGAVWDRLRAAGDAYGLQPAGLGARDTLRTEMGYPLHGSDISTAVTPLQARLGWAVGWSKDDFFGAAALRAEKAVGPTRLLRGLRAVGRGIPRPGMTVLDANGGTVGVITSGTFSPTLKHGIALALVAPDLAEGADCLVAVRNRREPFVVTRPPFVTPGVREG